jgi:nucleotidyltransferase substrate binding protein (TIGR01987 family)
MNDEDIRWEQRFSNYTKALEKLDEAVKRVSLELSNSEQADITSATKSLFWQDILQEGIIQRFEYTHELAWNVMKDYIREVGSIKTIGSRDTTREAFAAELITDGEVWMEMIKSRNMTSHTYNEHIAKAIFARIINDYHPAFLVFRDTMTSRLGGSQL